MNAVERRALVAKFLAVGYAGLSDTERMVIAFVVTPGGCHACGGGR